MTNTSDATHRLRLTVLIESSHSVADAVAFYRRAFALAGDVAPAASDALLEIGSILLSVEHGTNELDAGSRGTVPRLELRVDDVDVMVNRWVSAGARVKVRLARGSAAQPGDSATYAQVLDPYGHLWAFAQHDG